MNDLGKDSKSEQRNYWHEQSNRRRLAEKELEQKIVNLKARNKKLKAQNTRLTEELTLKEIRK